MAAFIIAASVFGSMGIKDAALLAALPAAMLMIFFRCTRPADARRAIDWNVILVMAAGLGIGEAMKVSGAAFFVTDGLTNFIKWSGGGNTMMLAIIFLVSVVLTNLITAKAAAVLVLPIALAAAESAGISAKPLIIAVIMGAAGSFATPFGYQTNLMVYGPGGYRSSDYLRLGVPLSIIVGPDNCQLKVRNHRNIYGLQTALACSLNLSFNITINSSLARIIDIKTKFGNY